MVRKTRLAALLASNPGMGEMQAIRVLQEQDRRHSIMRRYKGAFDNRFAN